MIKGGGIIIAAVKLYEFFSSKEEGPFTYHTRFIDFENKCSEPVTIRLEYYEHGLHNRWQWRIWDHCKEGFGPATFASGEGGRLVDFAGNPICGSRARLWWTTPNGGETFGGEQVLVSEPYVADEMESVVLSATPGKKRMQ